MARGQDHWWNEAPWWARGVLVVGPIFIAAALPIALARGQVPASVIAADAASQRSEASPTPASPQVPRTVELSFDAQVGLPKTAGAGQSLRVLDNGGNETGMNIMGGLLTHGEPTRNNAASYLEAQLPAEVRLLGADAVFSEGSGEIALISWQSSIVGARTATPIEPIPNGGIHFVAGPAGWHLGVWDQAAGREDVLSERAFAEPLVADGKTPHRFEVVRDGDAVWITTPTGVYGPIADPRIEEWSGQWACWELYEFSPDATPAAFAGVWAG